MWSIWFIPEFSTTIPLVSWSLIVFSPGNSRFLGWSWKTMKIRIFYVESTYLTRTKGVPRKKGVIFRTKGVFSRTEIRIFCVFGPKIENTNFDDFWGFLVLYDHFLMVFDAQPLGFDQYPRSNTRRASSIAKSGLSQRFLAQHPAAASWATGRDDCKG